MGCPHLAQALGLMGAASLKLSGVGLAYGQRCALADVNLAVPCCAVTAVIGPSGAGKSSLLLAINRLYQLIPGAQAAGTVHLDGVDQTPVDSDSLRCRIGTILQRPTPLPGTIRHNVAFPLRAHGAPRAELEGRVETALQHAALWNEVKDRLDAAASTLSGGQQQRLCIARALALQPRILLLDEPCASLDPAATAAVESTLRGIAGSTTLLLVTHNLGQALRLASRVAILWPGENGATLASEGPITQVLAAPGHEGVRDWLGGKIG